MRILAVLLILAAGSAPVAHAADDPRELVTAANAILCLEPGSLNAASQPDIAQSQTRLRGLHCLRTGSGIPLTVLERTHASIWKVSFRPEGMSGGVTLWGRISSFTTPDGEPLIHSTRAAR
jgi:hypothetical protein